MSSVPSSFLMLRVPLVVSGIIYFALALFVPSSPLFAELQGMSFQFQVLTTVFGLAAIGLACICHVQDSIVFWALFITTLLYVPSLFFFLGIPMLVFLLRPEVQDYYGVRLTKFRKS